MCGPTVESVLLKRETDRQTETAEGMGDCFVMDGGRTLFDSEALP